MFPEGRWDFQKAEPWCLTFRLTVRPLGGQTLESLLCGRRAGRSEQETNASVLLHVEDTGRKHAGGARGADQAGAVPQGQRGSCSDGGR